MNSKNCLTPVNLNNNLEKIKNLNFVNLNQSTIYKSKITRKTTNFEKISLKELITPMWFPKCKSKNTEKLEIHEKLKNFIVKQ